MIVSLYTSRVVLNTLGVEDYGIYSVVGGIVAMFTFINTAMVSSTQRYLNFELASGNEERLSSVFNTSLQIHILISVAIIFFAETLGMWFLLCELVIPESRIIAALWVYQCSIISCVVSIISAPYNAVIIAHEKMSAFAYISILEVSLKLLIVYLLSILSYDKLILYAILILLVQIFIRYIYSRYCHKHFKESFFKLVINKQLFKEMSSFAGWSFFGNLASVLYTQGLNIMLNVFFGPVVNAARGIAVQVQSAIQQFVSGFQTALNPQITKNYALSDFNSMHTLMFRSAKYSFFLLFFLSLPILMETNFVLTVWLKIVPPNAVIFTQFMVSISLVHTFANPCSIANQATGKVKVYQMIIGGILLTILPISYILLKLGFPAYSVFIVHFCVELIAQFFRMFILKKYIHLPILLYFKNIYIPVFLTIATAVVLPLFIHLYLDEGFLRFILVVIASIISVSISVFFIGFTGIERSFFINMALKVLKGRK